MYPYLNLKLNPNPGRTWTPKRLTLGDGVEGDQGDLGHQPQLSGHALEGEKLLPLHVDVGLVHLSCGYGQARVFMPGCQV